MKDWWNQVRSSCSGRIAVAFEQPAINLLSFFEDKDVDIFELNPSSTWGYRQSLKVSKARTDSSDAMHLAQFVRTHYRDLRLYDYGSDEARTIKSYTLSRRKVVDSRTALTNRLQDVLKRYYPELLSLMHEDIHRNMNMQLLKRWPTPQSICNARESSILDFFHSHGSRSKKRIDERLEVVRNIKALTNNKAIIEPAKMEALMLAEQIVLQNKQIQKYDTVIREVFNAVEDTRCEMVKDLPGAGIVLAPRIYSCLSGNIENCKSADDFSSLSGMAPVTESSGKMRKVYRRMRCDNYLRQTFYEWSKESWKHSKWAKAYVRYEQDRGKHFNTIIRCLATKWIRILYRLWKNEERYDEEKYIKCLISKNHYLKDELLKMI